MCNVLEYNNNKTKLLVETTSETNCDVVGISKHSLIIMISSKYAFIFVLQHISFDSYTDNIIVCVVACSSFIVVTLIVNKIGNQIVLSK